MLYDDDFNLLQDLRDKKTRIEVLLKTISTKEGDEKKKYENILKHVLDDMIDNLEDECLKNNVCPECGGDMVSTKTVYEYNKYCEDCGYVED